jgi:catechol 2,3-dioxygenase-like lactoylglutathione lyase family enzyme
MTGMRIEHVALQVSDPAAIAQWYVEHLGCSVARSAPDAPFVHFLKDGAGASMLELYRSPKAPVPDYAGMDPSLVHLAFVSPDPQADRDRLVAAGASIVEALLQTPAGDELVMLRDPWGLALQLVKRAKPMITA